MRGKMLGKSRPGPGRERGEASPFPFLSREGGRAGRVARDEINLFAEKQNEK